jgi:hypothetical protein
MNLRLSVAPDIPIKLLAVDAWARIADIGRDVLICQVSGNARTTFRALQLDFSIRPNEYPE